MSTLKHDIKRKKNILDEYRPLPLEIKKKLDNLNRIEIAYANLKLDGEDISREEVITVIMEEGYRLVKPPLKRVKIHNYSKLYEFVKNKVKAFRKNINNIKEKDILKIHRLLLRKVNETNAGKYRNIDIRIKEVKIRIPEFNTIPDMMKSYISWLDREIKKPDIIKVAADAHFKFIEITPFVDGNSRTARQIMNILLMQGGYPPLIVRPKTKKEYLKSIEYAQRTGKFENYYNIILSLISKSLDLYLDYL